jgi:hypothetical protein
MTPLLFLWFLLFGAGGPVPAASPDTALKLLSVRGV